MGQESLREPKRKMVKMGQLEYRGVKTGQLERRELGLEQEMETKALRLEELQDLWQQREMVQAWMALRVS